MKLKLLLFFVLLFSLNISKAQDIQLVNKIVGNTDPVNYYIGHYTVPGSDGLDLHWYGGIRFGDAFNPNVMQITNGKVGVGTTSPSYNLQVVGATGISEDLALGGSGRSVNWSNFSYGSYIDLNNSQNALRVRDKNNTIMLEVNGSNNYFTGNVGVGTTTPASKLDVRGVISTPEIAFRNADGGDDSDPYRLRKVQGSSNNNWLELQLNDDANESFRIYGNSCSGFGCGEISGNLYHSFDAQGNVFHSGNVGIGTTTPTAKLEVDGNTKINGNLIIGKDADIVRISGPTNSGAIQIKSNGSLGGSVNRYLRLGWNDNNNVFLPAMSINEDLNIGIGTTTPDEKLTVNGTIHVKEVRVDLVGWPDYVFADSYKLKPLSSIAQYIKENGHLPNVPSATEVEEKGLELSKIAKIQQEKIEELTLYLIHQSKEIEELKAEKETYKTLAERLAVLEKELKK